MVNGMDLCSSTKQHRRGELTAKTQGKAEKGKCLGGSHAKRSTVRWLADAMASTNVVTLCVCGQETACMPALALRNKSKGHTRMFC